MDSILEKRVLEIFKNSKKDSYWKSIDELQQLTNLNNSEIQQILSSSEKFARRNESGIFKFTTKENFRKYQSFGSKILGAFKNRIE